MDKTFFLLFFVFFLTVTLNADYLNTKTTNQCVYNVTPYQNNTGWCYTRRSDDRTFCSKSLKLSDLIDGYELVNGECLLKNDLRTTGLTESQMNEQFAFMGNFIGFVFLFVLSYVSVLIAGNRG